jgi:hypothetical protein
MCDFFVNYSEFSDCEEFEISFDFANHEDEERFQSAAKQQQQQQQNGVSIEFISR